MSEIVNAAIICCVITLFGLALGFVFLQIQAILKPIYKNLSLVIDLIFLFLFDSLFFNKFVQS